MLLRIVHTDYSITYEPITAEMLEQNLKLQVGMHSVSISYGGVSTSISVFVAPENGFIEAVGTPEFIGYTDTVTVSSTGVFNSSISIKGTFNLAFGGYTYSGFYGVTPVNQRFIQQVVDVKLGLRTYVIVTGNINVIRVIGNVNILVYDNTKTEEKVFLSEISIVNATDGTEMQKFVLDPDKPYLDLSKVEYTSDDYKLDFKFAKGEFTTYYGGIDSVVWVNNIVPFDPAEEGYTVSGDTDMISVNAAGDYVLNLSSGDDEIEVPYTTYSNNENGTPKIRTCKVHIDGWLQYELTDDMTLDDIKQDVINNYVLYVEYYEKVDGTYVHLIPIEESMIDLSKVNLNSFDLQTGLIVYMNKGVAINIVKPYTIEEDAEVKCTLTNVNGVHFVLSDATVDDLGLSADDACYEIVLYAGDVENEGVAVLKHTGNDIGDVLMGYTLNGNILTLLRHGRTVTSLNVTMTDSENGTFTPRNFNFTGMNSKTYTFNCDYDVDDELSAGWTATITAYYSGTKDYGYASVVLSGTATDDTAVADVEYVVTWATGTHNNKSAFVLRLADYDWWFEIGAADDDGIYSLDLVRKVVAS